MIKVPLEVVAGHSSQGSQLLADDEALVVAADVADIEILRLCLRYIQIIQAQIDLIGQQYFLNWLILIALSRCGQGILLQAILRALV